MREKEGRKKEGNMKKKKSRGKDEEEEKIEKRRRSSQVSKKKEDSSQVKEENSKTNKLTLTGFGFQSFCALPFLSLPPSLLLFKNAKRKALVVLSCSFLLLS